MLSFLKSFQFKKITYVCIARRMWSGAAIWWPFLPTTRWCLISPQSGWKRSSLPSMSTRTAHYGVLCGLLHSWQSVTNVHSCVVCTVDKPLLQCPWALPTCWRCVDSENARYMACKFIDERYGSSCGSIIAVRIVNIVNGFIIYRFFGLLCDYLICFAVASAECSSFAYSLLYWQKT